MFAVYLSIFTVTIATAAVALPYDVDSSFEFDYQETSFEDKRDYKYGNSLARAITYNKPMVPLEFWDKVKKKPRGRQMKESKLLEKV